MAGEIRAILLTPPSLLSHCVPADKSGGGSLKGGGGTMGAFEVIVCRKNKKPDIQMG